MAAASINQRGLIWLRVIIFIAAMAAGGAIIWFICSPCNPIALPAAVRGVIFIAVTAPLVWLLSDLGLHLRLGVVAGLGALFGAYLMANFPFGFGTSAEPIMDLAMAAGGMAALCYYIYAVRRYPLAADKIDPALYTALGVICMSLVTIWIVHIVHPSNNNGGAVRIPMLTLLWMSLRMTRKFVRNNSAAQPPTGQVVIS